MTSKIPDTIDPNNMSPTQPLPTAPNSSPPVIASGRQVIAKSSSNIPETILPPNTQPSTNDTLPPIKKTPHPKLNALVNRVIESITLLIYVSNNTKIAEFKSQLAQLKNEKNPEHLAALMRKIDSFESALDDWPKDIDTKLVAQECKKLKSECQKTLLKAMEQTTKDLIGKIDVKSDLLKQLNTKSTTETKEIPAGDEGEPIETPIQFYTDSHRQAISVNGSLIVYDKKDDKNPTNDAAANQANQITRKFIKKIDQTGKDGRTALLKLGPLIQQTMPKQILEDLQCGLKEEREKLPPKSVNNLPKLPGCIANHTPSVVQELCETNEKLKSLIEKHPTLLDPTFDIQVKKDGSVQIHYNIISKLTDPEGTHIFKGMLFRIFLSMTISKEEFESGKPINEMQIDNVESSISNFILGYENVEQLLSLRERVSIFLDQFSRPSLSQTYSQIKATLLDSLPFVKKQTAEKVDVAATEIRLEDLKAQCSALLLLDGMGDLRDEELAKLAEKAFKDPAILEKLNTIIKKYETYTEVKGNPTTIASDDINWIRAQIHQKVET